MERVNSKHAHNARDSLPPSEDGEWWELTDDSRGIPYYYQTKTGETVWERPDAFVIPLGILQARNRSSVSASMPKLTGATYRTPRLLVGFLHGSAQTLKITVTFRPRKTGKTANKTDYQVRANDLSTERRVLHTSPWVMVHPNRATRKGVHNRLPGAQEVGLPLQVAPPSLGRLGM